MELNSRMGGDRLWADGELTCRWDGVGAEVTGRVRRDVKVRCAEGASRSDLNDLQGVERVVRIHVVPIVLLVPVGWKRIHDNRQARARVRPHVEVHLVEREPVPYRRDLLVERIPDVDTGTDWPSVVVDRSSAVGVDVGTNAGPGRTPFPRCVGRTS